MPFLEKTNFFVIWIKSVKNNFQWEGIWSSCVLLDYTSALLSNKFAFLLSHFPRTNSLDYFILSKYFLNFSYFLLSFFYTYFANLFYNSWSIMTYTWQNVSVDCENKKLSRYVHIMLKRSFLWNSRQWIKTFTNQNFQFSIICVYGTSWVF